MRLPYITVAIVAVISLLADWYIYRVLRKRFRSRIPARVQFWTAAACLALLITIAVMPFRSGDDAVLRAVMWMLYTYITIYAGKFVFIIFDLTGSLPRLWHGRPWRALSWLGAFLGVFVFGAFWYGALVGRYQLQTNRVDIYSEQVPPAFDGFTIAQISDLHTGTYGNDTTFICNMVGEVNSLNPDLIVFTGDIVNRRSSELQPFVHALSRLEAPYGVYSVLGNHDYGDYSNWPDAGAKEANLQLLKDMQKDMGWRMLNNDYSPIALRGDTIMLIGVENVGDPPFHTYGSLEKAYPDVADSHAKILLSHNPAHWDNDIQGNPDKNIFLTMSGHTHAMQIEFANLSPAAFRYRHWAGLYRDGLSHRMYVNIGVGAVGFPARVGATPEITLFTLHHAPGRK